eukprot:m.214926 g.214926  ORF g.214926 m.214926 type:complete len:311 (-) comp38271_c0_seq1:80-1012(-)
MGRTSLRLASHSPPKAASSPPANGGPAPAVAASALSSGGTPTVRAAGPTSSSGLFMASPTPSGSKLVRFTPVDVTDVALPADLEVKLVSHIAENIHEVWSKGLIDRGWSYGPVRNDEQKKHHLLIPYDELSEEDKSYDVELSRDTLRVLMKKGFGFKKTGKDLSSKLCMKLDERYRQSNGYLPRPLDDRSVVLSPDLLMLADMLAENMHNVWACKKMADGWTYARVNDAIKRHSPNLLPYNDLSEDAQFSNRNSSLSIIRMLSVLGYSIVPKEELRTSNASKAACVGVLLALLLAYYLHFHFLADEHVQK